jgi:hypothetical protein
MKMRCVEAIHEIERAGSFDVVLGGIIRRRCGLIQTRDQRLGKREMFSRMSNYDIGRDCVSQFSRDGL